MSCYREEASFSYRINTDNKEVRGLTQKFCKILNKLFLCWDDVYIILITQVECVGGPEDYKALCRRCYMNHTQVLPSISNGVSNGISKRVSNGASNVVSNGA